MTSSPETRPFGNSPATCGYSRVLELISDKWTALVMYTLRDGSVRYGEMGRRIDGISKKMLTQTVRKLERDGLVRRHVTPTVPPTVDYSLTPLGETLLQPMKELRQWARVNYPHVEAARADYDLAHGGDSQPPAE